MEKGRIIKVAIPPGGRSMGFFGENMHEDFSTISLYGERIKRRGMIYPTTLKKRYRAVDPFRRTFSEAEKCLKNDNALLVIGHSFGDPGVRQMIRRAKQKNKKLRIGSIGGPKDPVRGLEITRFGETLESV